VEIKAFGLNIDTDTITDKQRMIAGVVIGVLLIGGSLYWNKPTYDSYQDMLVEIDKLTADKEGKEAQVAKLPALKQEYEALQISLRRLESQIPRTENVPTLLMDMEKLSANHDVFLSGFVPGALTPVTLPAAVVGDGKATATLQDQLRQLPVKITSTAAYPNVVDMFTAFERYERTLAADSITIASGGKSEDGKKSLTVMFNLNAYVLLGGANGKP
jgi:Tfp pilus assembly protein PilO